MGVKDDFMGAAVLSKVALIVAFLANMCSWIAFTTTSWLTFENPGTSVTSHVGLWRTCSDASFASCSMLDGHGDASLNAVQAFAIFGFGALNIAFLLIVLSMFYESCKGNADNSMTSAILMFVSGGCWLLAVIIFGAEFEDVFGPDGDLDYSFGLAIVAMILAVVSGILVLLGRGGGAVSSS